MKVIVADKISDRGVKLLKEQPGWNVVMTSKDSLNAEIADADALIVRSATKVTAELLDRGEKLRAVGRAGVGVDNIDLDEATKRGVLVMSTPGGSSVSVAEHTFALLLALVRQLPRFDAAMREGRCAGPLQTCLELCSLLLDDKDYRRGLRVLHVDQSAR